MIRMHDNKPKEDKSIIRKFLDGIMNHFFITFIILFIINMFFLTSRNIPIVIGLIAFLLLIVYVILFLMMRIQINIRKLLHHELKLGGILTVYITSVIFIVLLFSIAYWSMTFFGVGYLKYGSCVDNVDLTRDIIFNDTSRVINPMHYPYFSAITFFTVGYGDICPMGASKMVSTLNVLIGNAFTILILGIAITNYAFNKSNEKKRKE
jgi:hypothetical protein